MVEGRRQPRCLLLLRQRFLRPPVCFFADPFFAAPFFPPRAAPFAAVFFLLAAAPPLRFAVAFDTRRAVTFTCRRAFLTTRRTVRFTARRVAGGTARSAVEAAVPATCVPTRAAPPTICDVVFTAVPSAFPTTSADRVKMSSACRSSDIRPPGLFTSRWNPSRILRFGEFRDVVSA